MKTKILFYIFLVLSFLCFVCTWFKYENKNYINVIVETRLQQDNDILLKINKKYYGFKQFDNILNQTIKNNVDSLELLVSLEHKNKIKDIVIFNDIKMYYFSDFSELEKASEEICFAEHCKSYDKYKFKKEIITSHKNKIYAFVNALSQFDKIFYLFFIFLALTIFYGCKLKINKFILPSCIFILAFIFRLSDINSYLPWGDECYAIEISSTHYPFLNLFNDPGNPPFYFFLLRVMQYFTDSFMGFRFLSIIFSLCAGVFLFLFLKNNYSLKIANFAAFLFAINLPIIYFSQEIRCYSLTVLLAVLFIIYTFKILKNANRKYWIIYGILSIVAVNTHYYQVIFVLTNFLYLAFSFIKNKRNKDLVWLLGVNFLTLLSFLPYYLLTAYNQAYLNVNFNTALPEITFELIKKFIFFVFGGFIPLLLSAMFLFKKTNLKLKSLYCYCFWVIFSVFSIGIILSLIIRPMMAERYVLFLIPFALIILSIIFSQEYKRKWVYVFVGICIFLMQNYSKHSFSHIRMKTSQSYNTFEIAREYKKKNNKDVLLILKPSDSAIKKLFKFDDLKTQTVAQDNSYKISKEKIDKIKKINKDMVIFTSHLNYSGNVINSKNYTCYFNSTLDVCIWKID